METHEEFTNRVLGAPQDISLPILEQLLQEGYDAVKWHVNPGATDVPCVSMENKDFPLADFIANLAHAAPIFEKTHVGCKCSVEVTGPGKSPVHVTAFGREG